MIVKFDHISVVEERKNKDKLIAEYGIENLLFNEENLRNLEIKREFMQIWQEDHDLYFFSTEGKLATELIFYDVIKGQTRVSVNDKIIYGEYGDKSKAISFLKNVFGERYKVIEEGDKLQCNLRGVLDREDIWLVLNSTTNSGKTFLDERGYGVITLVTNAPYQGDSSISDFTGYETLKVNNRKLSICFTKTNDINIIFELIMLERE